MNRLSSVASITAFAAGLLLGAPPASVAERLIRLSGRLAVFDETHQFPRHAGLGCQIDVTSSDANLLTVNQVGDVDNVFGWRARATLYGESSVELMVRASCPGFIQYKPRPPHSIKVFRGKENIADVSLTLGTRERAKRDEFHLGNLAMNQVPANARSNDALVHEAIGHFDEALAYVEDPAILHVKASLLHRVREFKACAFIYERLTGVLETVTTKAVMTKEMAWQFRLDCMREWADGGGGDEAWKSVAATARGALDANLPGPRIGFIATWLDALLKLSKTKDLSVFAVRVDEDDDLREQWTALYYKHFRRRPPPAAFSPSLIRTGAQQVVLARQAKARAPK